MKLKHLHWLLLIASLGCFVVGTLLVSMATSDNLKVVDSSTLANDMFWAGCGAVLSLIGTIVIIAFVLWIILKAAIVHLLRPAPGSGLSGHLKQILFVIVIVFELGVIGSVFSFCAALIAMSLSKHHPASEFETDAFSLRYARNYWISNGQPADFRLEEVVGPPEDFFIFTNTIETTNGVLHCRFGSRRPGWPPGVLAITDEGQMIFVCSTNGKVTISPDKYGVDP